MIRNDNITAVAGKPFPGRRGFVIGECGHAVDKKAWQAEETPVCEQQCPASAQDGPQPPQDAGLLLRPAEVAAMFHVNPRTVTKWANEGKLGALKTPGGTRRFYESEVRAHLNWDDAS